MSSYRKSKVDTILLKENNKLLKVIVKKFRHIFLIK